MKLLVVLWFSFVSTHAFVIHPTAVRQLLGGQMMPSSSLKMMDALESSSLVDMASAAATTIIPPSDLSLRNVNVWIFLAGIFPFAWATVEFWRRIAVGEPFGTGKDSVRIVSIGKDDVPTQSRGRQSAGSRCPGGGLHFIWFGGRQYWVNIVQCPDKYITRLRRHGGKSVVAMRKAPKRTDTQSYV
jgi:hypothetical protein